MTTSNRARHLLVRLHEPARLPDALLAALRDEVVLAGWLRASGVLADVVLRTFDAESGKLGEPRRLKGPVQVLVLDGSIGLREGDVSCGLRAVLARETDRGLETLGGEITEARVVSLEAVVLALDDVAATREIDASGVALLTPDPSTSLAPPAAPAAPAPAAPAPAVAAPAAAPTWAEAAREGAAPAPAPTPRPSPAFSGPAPLPLRPVRAAVDDDEDEIYPEEGDVVDHFAFGRCEVVKSDGDRLHVRLGKDGRIKEIALEMLRITPLPAEEGAASKLFKLARKL